MLTYIQRVYYPAIVREPEIIPLENGHVALWLHSAPLDLAASELHFSMAVVVPALHDLPAALVQAEDIVSQLGENFVLCAIQSI